MDLYVQHKKEEDICTTHSLYDVTLSSPPGGWSSIPDTHATRTKNLDTYIAESEKEKYFRYDTSFRATEGTTTNFYPIAFDRSGRISEASKAALKTIKKILTYNSRSASSKYSVGQALTDRISVAFQNGIGRHISSARQLHNRHARLAAAVVAQAAAAAGGGGLPVPLGGGGGVGGGAVPDA